MSSNTSHEPCEKCVPLVCASYLRILAYRTCSPLPCPGSEISHLGLGRQNPRAEWRTRAARGVQRPTGALWLWGGVTGFPCFFSGSVNAAAEDVVVGATGCLTSGHQASLSASETGLSEAIGGAMLPCVDICRAEWPTVWATESACLDSDHGSPTHDLLTLGKLFPGWCLSFPSINELDDSTCLTGLSQG